MPSLAPHSFCSVPLYEAAAPQITPSGMWGSQPRYLPSPIICSLLRVSCHQIPPTLLPVRPTDGAATPHSAHFLLLLRACGGRVRWFIICEVSGTQRPHLAQPLLFFYTSPQASHNNFSFLNTQPRSPMSFCKLFLCFDFSFFSNLIMSCV